MAANLTARQLRVFIGGDDQDWSFAAVNFLPEQQSMGESGLVKTFASITLLDVLGNPESLDPRANPARWREGQTVRVDVATDAGGWFTWGYLRLIEIPSGPSDGAITLQLGCALAWADDPQPEGDRSEVALGIGENSATVATRLLVASGIPESAIALGAWDYELPYALQKEGNGSYVAQAGALAWANHCRMLCQEPDGVIRPVQWDAAAGEPVAIVTVGLNEALFEPTPDPVPPVERVVVSGVGFQPVTTPGRYSSKTSKEIPAALYKDEASGTVTLSTTIVNTITGRKIRSETRTTYPKITKWIGSEDLGIHTQIQYEEKTYSTSESGFLTKVESGVTDSIRTLLPLGASTSSTDIVKTTIDYTYNSNEVLIRTVETTEEPRIKVDPGAQANRLDLIEAQVTEIEWREERPDYWVQRESTEIAASRVSGGVGGRDTKATALIPQPPTISRNSRPPATDRWEDPTSLKEQHYTAECTWQHPGGATGRVRTRSLTVDPAFSNAQCFDIATREVRLLEGRRESYLIELPLSDALLWLPPLSTIQVDDGANLWTFKLDATAWEYGLDGARLVAVGICVARVPVAVPVGVLLPEFESGLEPGQVAPEEPAPFEVPADEVLDVAVALSAAPASISAEATLKQTAIAALSAAPATIAASTVATQAVATALSAAPASITAEIELRGAVSAALSAAPATIAASTVATQVVAVALSAAPAQVVATVSNPDPILSNLLAWYRLDEASGNAIDAHVGSYALTQVGSVGSATGKRGNARTFSGSDGSYLSSSNAVFTRGDTDLYMAGWVWVNAGGFTIEPAIAGRYTFSTNDRSYMLQVSSAGNARFVCSSNGVSATIVQSSGAISADTWTFVEVYHNAATDQIGVALNGGSFAVAAFSGGLFAGTAPFAVGRANIGGTPGIALSGRVDELALWSRILTTDERARLYNSGNGFGYPG